MFKERLKPECGTEELLSILSVSFMTLLHCFLIQRDCIVYYFIHSLLIWVLNGCHPGPLEIW